MITAALIAFGPFVVFCGIFWAFVVRFAWATDTSLIPEVESTTDYEDFIDASLREHHRLRGLHRRVIARSSQRQGRDHVVKETSLHGNHTITLGEPLPAAITSAAMRVVRESVDSTDAAVILAALGLSE